VAGAGLAGAALCRLAGAAALDLMDRPWLAATSAEFWRWWNRPAQQFFYEDVFKPCGGWRAPVRGTLAAFAASAAVHEYVFGLATGVAGYQTAFFLLNGCAAAATLGARPTGLYRVAGVALTLAFILGTAVLFFRSVDAVLPCYDRRPSHHGQVRVGRTHPPLDRTVVATPERPVLDGLFIIPWRSWLLFAVPDVL
jgi:hypothetical protein